MKILALRLFVVLSIFLFMANPATTAEQLSASSGYTPTRIQVDTEVSFTATVYNLQDRELYIQGMNVSFTEGSASGSSTNVDTFYLTKSYPESRRALPANSSFSDRFTIKVSFEPGTYNVSIFFANSNESDSRSWNPHVYALTNETVVIIGVNDTLKFLLGLGIFFGVTAIVIIGLMVYNSKFKK